MNDDKVDAKLWDQRDPDEVHAEADEVFDNAIDVANALLSVVTLAAADTHTSALAITLARNALFRFAVEHNPDSEEPLRRLDAIATDPINGDFTMSWHNGQPSITRADAEEDEDDDELGEPVDPKVARELTYALAADLESKNVNGTAAEIAALIRESANRVIHVTPASADDPRVLEADKVFIVIDTFAADLEDAPQAATASFSTKQVADWLRKSIDRWLDGEQGALIDPLEDADE
jgi:hypothetical protein